MDPLITAFIDTGGYTKMSQDERLRSVTCDVAKIPWGEGRTIDDVLKTKGVGTCTGKHLVLQSCFEQLGIPYRITVCTFHWSAQKLPLPKELTMILEEGEWEHGHNFLQIQNDDGKWIDVDITWDPFLKPHGFRTFPENWDGKTSFVGLHPLIHRWDNADPDMKQEWIKALTPEMRERRERFLHGFFGWIASLRKVTCD